MVAALYSRLLFCLVLTALVGAVKNQDKPVIILTPQEVSNIEKIITCDYRKCCPKPFKNVKEECFYLSSRMMTWQGARDNCREIKGDLIVPKDLKILKDFILNIAGPLKVFVGGQDVDRDGRFKWLNGDIVRTSDWAKGEPDHAWNKEFCLGFDAGLQPMLFDKNCDNTLRFVCQYRFPK